MPYIGLYQSVMYLACSSVCIEVYPLSLELNPNGCGRQCGLEGITRESWYETFQHWTLCPPTQLFSPWHSWQWFSSFPSFAPKILERGVKMSIKNYKTKSLEEVWAAQKVFKMWNKWKGRKRRMRSREANRVPLLPSMDKLCTGKSHSQRVAIFNKLIRSHPIGGLL